MRVGVDGADITISAVADLNLFRVIAPVEACGRLYHVGRFANVVKAGSQNPNPFGLMLYFFHGDLFFLLFLPRHRRGWSISPITPAKDSLTLVMKPASAMPPRIVESR